MEESVDWTSHSEEMKDYALMACNSSNQTQSTKPSELVSEPVVNESNVECQPKVWSDAPIIEEYESDSEDEDCDFHEKRMAKQAELNNGLNRNSGQMEIRPIWNNVQKVNNQNQFVPTAVLTRTGKIPVNTARASGTKNVSTARHSFNRQAVLTSTAIKVSAVEGKRETAVKPSADEKPVDKEDQVFLDELERLKRKEKDANDAAKALRKEFAQETENLLIQARATKASGTNIVNTVSTPAKASSTNIVNTVSTPVKTASPYDGLSLSDPTNPKQDDSEIPAFEDIYLNPTNGIFTNSSYDDEGAVANFTNLETVVNVSPIPTSGLYFLPSALILEIPNLQRNNHKDFQHCLFACFLSQNEPKKISEALEDENLPYGKKAIGTKWVYRNKKDERGVVVRNKARLVAQGHKQEEGIDYDEVFALVARIEAIRIFLAFASYMGFIVYQMDVKSAFLYGKIDEENGYRRGTIDKTLFIKKDKHDIILVQVYVDDIIFGSTKKSWCDEFEALMKSRFQMSSMGELTFFLGLQVKQKADGIFISQDKYVVEILKKFDFVNVKTASTPIETQKPLVCACSRFQVTLKSSHLSAVKRIFSSDYAGKQILTWKKSQQEVVNFLAGDSFLGNAKSRPLWLLLLQRHNMLLLQAVMGKFCGFKIKWKAYEKKLIQVLKIYTDDNVADLLTKAFDVSRVQKHFNHKVMHFKEFIGIHRVIKKSFRCEATVDPQPDPSPRPSPSTTILDSIPESSGENHGGQSSSDKSLSGNEGDMTLQSVYDLCISLCTHVSDQAKEIQKLKAQIKKLKKQAKPVITHHRAWLKSVSLKKRLAGKRSLKQQWMQRESVSKQGRKSAKGEPSVHKDNLFDEIPEDSLDYMETEDAQDVGRTRDVVDEEKENAEDVLSTEDVLSIAQQKVSTDKEKVSTDRPIVSTDGSKVSTDKEKDSTGRTDEGTDGQTEGGRATQATQTTRIPTSTIFGDDETIAQVLLNMSQAKAVSREKEKGVEFKDVEETERRRPTSTRSLLTLKPLPKIDPKDKVKKKIEEEDESESESDGIPEAEKKFMQLASDEEMARKVQEEWECEEERKRLAEEEATNDALIRNYDDIKARIEG
ncbi:putative ribonuclease H-like domain-containing protein [Tanacetum coccineum]